MSAPAGLRARLFQPGPIAFASLFAWESMARALVTVVLAVVALRALRRRPASSWRPARGRRF
jgi:hypothetical protein